jgi:hypothetical protein
VCSAPFDHAGSSASNGRVGSFTVTADDRSWFVRCRRAWDLGARARRSLEALASPARPTLERAMRDALAVHYFPGMWTWDRRIVEPLVRSAFARGGGPPEGRRLVDAFLEWTPGYDRFTPVRTESDIEVFVPDPERAETNLTSPDGSAVRYRDRVALVLLDEDGRCWIGAHRLVADFATDDELRLDEREVTACWAWEQDHLGMQVSGTQYTEFRVEPIAFRRTTVTRSRAELQGAARRLGLEARAMTTAPATVEPTPAWGHCRACAFRAPCIAMNHGDDPSDLLARDYRSRPPDELEEGRLGGTSWGLGRGAAPPRFS